MGKGGLALRGAEYSAGPLLRLLCRLVRWNHLSFGIELALSIAEPGHRAETPCNRAGPLNVSILRNRGRRDGSTNMATGMRPRTDIRDKWADLNGRWFFAWRMAAACEDALQEMHLAMARQQDPKRVRALEKISQLLHRELLRWVRRGEALDMIVEHLPRQAA